MIAHVQTVNISPFLSSHTVWVQGYSTVTKKLECSTTKSL